jgi:hypothetical protein
MNSIQTQTKVEGQKSALLSFIVMTVFYLTYQLLVFFSYISPIFGGYFTVGALIAFPLLFVSFIKQRRYLQFWRTTIGTAYIFFILLFLMSVMIGVSQGKDQNILISHYAALIKFTSVFLLAICLDAQAHRVKILAAISIIAFCLIVLSLPSGALHSNYVDTNNFSDLFQVNYQASASVIIIFLIYYLRRNNGFERYLVYTAACYSIYELGARFELIASVLVVFSAEYIRAKNKYFYACIVALLAFFSLFAYALLFRIPLEGRIFGLLNISSDESFIQRQDLTYNALETVVNNPIFGNYASYYPGMYAHNIISVWVDFGIIGLFLLLYIIMLPLFTLIRRFSKESHRVIYSQAACAILVVIVSMLAAKDYTYTLIPFAIGLYCRYQRIRIIWRGLP